MEMKKIINNKIPCIQIIDDKGEYLLAIASEDLNKTEKEQIAIAQQKYDEIKFREANPPAPTVQELRKKELDVVSPIDEMVVALWEDVVENRPEARDKLQAQRVEVKNKYPKK